MNDPIARPSDFDAYWDAVNAELAAYPMATELEPLPLRSTEFSDAYAVRLTSLGPYRIFGYYSVPKGDGPFPGLLLTPRYGSVNHVPDYQDRRRCAVLQIMHRGQRLADQPFRAAYPGLLTHGIEDRATSIYRGIVADCVRAAEFLTSRAEVDGERIGVVGDDLALIAAARRPRFKAVLAFELMLYRLMEASERSSAYPVEELNDYLRTYPDRRAAVAQTLAYFDPLHHVGRIAESTTTLLSIGDSGSLGGPEWLEPLERSLGGKVERFVITHAGRTDQDNLDAWMAAQLGVEPLSRF